MDAEITEALGDSMPVPEHLAAAPCEHGVELDMCDTLGCEQEYNRLSREGDLMDELVAWYRQQLDDDERAARFAFAEHNNAGPDWHEVRSGAIQLGPHEDELVTFDAGISRHIARHDPAAVLADIAAKRKLIDEYESAARFYATHKSPSTPDVETRGLRTAITLTARAYRHKPGWKTEWEA